jgi:hypothetical protein
MYTVASNFYLLFYDSLNMANSGEIVSSEVDTTSTFLSAVETEPDTALVSVNRTTQTSRLVSSIHKHCRTATTEEKKRTKKIYFYKYYSPQDPKGHHASTAGLQRHLRKHGVEWSIEENDPRMTVRD